MLRALTPSPNRFLPFRLCSGRPARNLEQAGDGWRSTFEGLRQVFQNIVDVLGANRQANGIGLYALLRNSASLNWLCVVDAG